MHAQGVGSVEARLRQARDESARSKRERDSLALELRRLETTARDMAAEAKNLERQTEATTRALNSLDRQLRTINSEVDSASGSLVRAQDELVVKRATLKRRLVDIYKRGPLHSAEVLLGANSFGELVARYKYLRVIALRDQALLKRTEQLQTEVKGQHDVLVVLQNEMARSRAEKAEEEQRLRSLEDQWAQRLSRTQSQAQVAQRQLTRAMRDAAQLDSIVADLDAARRRGDTRAVTSAPGVKALSPADAGRLDWPVEGEIIYSFGRVVNPNNTVIRLDGIGISATAGTPVRAVADGTVVRAEPIGTYGNTVLLLHGNDVTMYASLGRVHVGRGENVKKGQVIGVVGINNPELGPHLHFEIRPNLGKAVDPMDWLKRR